MRGLAFLFWEAWECALRCGSWPFMCAADTGDFKDENGERVGVASGSDPEVPALSLRVWVCVSLCLALSRVSELGLQFCLQFCASSLRPGVKMPLEFELCPGRAIGGNHPCFIIAEIGQNHQGDIKIAKEMIKMAKVRRFTSGLKLLSIFKLNIKIITVQEMTCLLRSLGASIGNLSHHFHLFPLFLLGRWFMTISHQYSNIKMHFFYYDFVYINWLIIMWKLSLI